MYEPILEKMDKPVYNRPEQWGFRINNVPIQISAGNL